MALVNIFLILFICGLVPNGSHAKTFFMRWSQRDMCGNLFYEMEWNLLFIKKEKCQVYFRNLASLLFIIEI